MLKPLPSDVLQLCCRFLAARTNKNVVGVKTLLLSVATARASSSLARRKFFNRVSAESDWLQTDGSSSSPPNSSLETESGEQQLRFDWRQRASSRVAKKFAEALVRSGESRQYLHRKEPPKVELQPGEEYFEEVETYKEKFLPLLEAEQAEDEAVLKERLSTWSLARLRKEGYTLTGLSAFWLPATQFGRPVAAFGLGPGVVLPEHRFQTGTQVLLSRLDPLSEPPLRGSIVSDSPTELRISFPEIFDLYATSPWRLDIGSSNIIYERMRTAISHFNHNPLNHELNNPSPNSQYILQGTYMRDILLRSFSHLPALPSSGLQDEADTDAGDDSLRTGSVFDQDMRIRSWSQRYRLENPIVMDSDPVLEGLNATQIRAIAMMLGERISLVQGPPGTGKTKTLVAAIKLLKTHFEVPQRILVCSYTNVAVDNLVAGLVKQGLNPLRVGHGTHSQSIVSKSAAKEKHGSGSPSVSGDEDVNLVEYTLESRLYAHPLRPQAEKLAKDEEGLKKRLDDLNEKISRLPLTSRRGGGVERIREEIGLKASLASLERRMNAVSAKSYAVRQKMLQDVISEADVICTTCLTSASISLKATDFPVVFLDEASMSTEPASLIPLMKGSQHIALIGDHKQLPPIITSKVAQDMGLGTSLFERLIKEKSVPSLMLGVQYRMHPSISRFPSSEFYNLSLLDGTVDSTGQVSPTLLPPVSQHLVPNSETGQRPSIVFLDHEGTEMAKDRSRVNHSEARIVCGIIEDLLLNNPGLMGCDIGIIAPYVAQISLLTRLLRTEPSLSHFRSVLGHHRSLQLSQIEVKTVDGFEGGEKDVIIFSTVRNNAGGHIGFLADRRRLNVGLTRAKRGLFVVGSLNTLGQTGVGVTATGKPGVSSRARKGTEAWKRYAQFLSQEGLVVRWGDRLPSLMAPKIPL